MRLRKWCVSEIGETLRFFWTLHGAERYHRERLRFAGVAERSGLYWWDGAQWKNVGANPAALSNRQPQ